MPAKVHVCIPVLRRYDLLRELLLSLRESTLQPASIRIINNGQNAGALLQASLNTVDTRIYSYTPTKPLGVAESWNWFLTHAPKERLITNDDVTFAPQSLEKLLEASGEFITATPGNAFSCFILRDSLIEKIGTFDETISPGYAYFEDCDYEERMYEQGILITHVECGVKHLGSGTLPKTDRDLRTHHQRFIIAQENFVKKWGRMPRGKERQFA